MSGTHFADARAHSLFLISANYSVVCRFRLVYVSRATNQPVGRLATDETNDLSAAPAAYSRGFAASPLVQYLRKERKLVPDSFMILSSNERPSV